MCGKKNKFSLHAKNSFDVSKKEENREAPAHISLLDIDKMADWAILPIEMLGMIALYLPFRNRRAMIQVCERWAQALRQLVYWPELSPVDHYYDVLFTTPNYNLDRVAGTLLAFIQFAHSFSNFVTLPLIHEMLKYYAAGGEDILASAQEAAVITFLLNLFPVAVLLAQPEQKWYPTADHNQFQLLCTVAPYPALVQHLQQLFNIQGIL